MRRPALLAYLIAVFAVVADQLSKWWVTQKVGLRFPGDKVEISSFFDLTLVWNRGVSFGLFSSPAGQETARWILSTVAAGVVVALAIWVWRTQRLWAAVSAGLIMGGAIGNNIIDRVRLGHVIDFLDFGGIGFKWVFNVADVAINVGVAILLIETFLPPEKGKATAKPAEETQP